MKHILFVCNQGQFRSRTAQDLFQHDPDIEARAVGIDKTAPQRITPEDLTWADMIYCMMPEHRKYIYRMGGTRSHLNIGVLFIPDDYDYNQPELVQILTNQLSGLLRKEEII